MTQTMRKSGLVAQVLRAQQASAIVRCRIVFGAIGTRFATSVQVRVFLRPVLFVILAIITTPALAERAYDLPTPLTVEAVVRTANEHRAEIVAATARARAAAQRPRIESALPDPMLMASVDHLPFSFMGVDASLALEQQFPLSRVLSRRGRAAQANANRQASEIARVALDVERDALEAYYMLFERRRLLEVLDEIHATTEQLRAVAEAHYAAAHGTQAEALRAESELLRVESERAALASEVNAAEAMLNAALGRNPELAIPKLSPPGIERDPPALSLALTMALARRPELAAMRHERARALAEVDVMQSMYGPMAVVRAGPSYTMAEGAGVMLMLGVSLPIWRDRLHAGVDEANAMVQMANAELAAMRNMIQGEVTTARAQLEAERTRLKALREQVRPKSQQAVDAALASYTAARTSAVAVIEALRALWEVRADEVMSEARLGLAWARFSRATGDFGPAQRRKP